MYFWIMTSDAFKNPDRAQNLCCFPIQIKAIYCPFIWLALFTIMMFAQSLFVWAGFIIGICDAYDWLKFATPSMIATVNASKR